MLIAEQIVVGNRVTVTWERPVVGVPGAPGTPPPKAQPPKSTALAGVDGDPGDPGGSGSRGWDGREAPSLEIWTLQMNASRRCRLE